MVDVTLSPEVNSDPSASSMIEIVSQRRQRIARVESKRPAGGEVIIRRLDLLPAAAGDLVDAVQALLDRVRKESGG
jgi:hypothetical protein